MGIRVSAAQAAQLVARSEKAVRQWIQSGKLEARPDGPNHARHKSGPSRWSIDVDALAGVPGVVLDRELLARLEASDARSAATVAARVDQLERELQQLRVRLRAMELRDGTAWPSTVRETGPARVLDGEQGAATLEELRRYASAPESPLSAHLVQQEQQSATASRLTTAVYTAAGGTFRTRADAARFLARHGVNERTPKTWRGWQDVPLEPRAVLADALSRSDPANWRIPWRLTRCEDPACCCWELLEA